jgi:hypothetical protein
MASRLKCSELKGQQALFVGWNLEESEPSKENFNGDPAFW